MEIRFLIDVAVSGLIQIPKVSREAFPGALESFWTKGPSFLDERWPPGVPTVQKTQGRKCYNEGKESYTGELFAWESGIARPQGVRLVSDRFCSPRKTFLLHATIFFSSSHFPKSLKFPENMFSGQNH